MSEKSGIVILGIFAADTAYKAKRLPQIAETLMGSGFTLGPGGKGSNQAIAAAKAGGKVTFISRVGNDAFGAMALAAYAEAGVTANVMKMDGVSTGAAFIFVDEASGDNAIIVVPGAAGLIGIEDVEANRAAIESAAIFMTQLEQPLEAALHGLSIAKRAGATTIFNPAPASTIPDSIYGLSDFIVPNEVEAAQLVGHAIETDEQARAAARTLVARGARAAVITLGARGALYHTAEQSEFVPAFSAGNVVDTTGAGDAFLGGFATAISEGRAPIEAVRFGCATAAIAVTRPGTAPAMPSRAEISALLGS
ncbi:MULTISPECIES: ribokinase [unclassified Rhizobium]|uniref:ribokinase n=1 Tax=unclassified Rhizobium TaxID=2613769 RepID=UPI001C832885|nr:MULTISPECIES: ribokinase [unclassified Rhizobium]MBX5218695.1 ribokinase [Rhizobium sp. NLR9a]MBX5242633.1 ribokinase [Rhizobium sp. NLR22b]MBX5248731.1 ribokinase [Rhizobium sp. NLR3b]MBX5254796.1 ribokinase [Rhizobium sp. NLR4b]MBX5273278.1 ribokinase [Rhizobium sp. NLR17b]